MSTHSSSVLASSLHDLGDATGFGISWYLEKYSQQKSDASYSYGYRRFSVLGAIVTSVFVLTSSCFVLYDAVNKLLNPALSDLNLTGMSAIAVFGLLVNGGLALKTRSHASLHHKMVSWHLLEDALGWFSVLVVSMLMRLGDFAFLDPLASLGITILVLYQALKNVRPALRVLLQAVPNDVSMSEIEAKIRAMPSVQSLHHLRLWSLDNQEHVFTAHVVVNASTELAESLRLKQAIKSLLLESQIADVVIEIEWESEVCLSD